jgi:hypothetical protein
MVDRTLQRQDRGRRTPDRAAHRLNFKEASVIRERVGGCVNPTKERVRRAVIGVLAVAAVIAVSGCAVFDPSHPPAATQTKTLGPVAVTVTVCSGQSGNSSAPPGSCTRGDGNSDDQAFTDPSQLFLGFRVPSGTGVPSSFTSSSTGPTGSGPQLAFTQNQQYTGELQRLQPAPLGEEWVGYTSQYVSYSSTSGDQNFTATVDFGLPTHTDGSPFSGPFTWQAVVGGRAFNAHDPTPPVADAPVDCENSLTIGYGGPSGPEWICVDDQFPATLGTDNQLATRDAGITPGPPSSALPGTVASVPFNLAYAGAATPAATFTLNAATSLAGATATPSQGTLAPASNSSSPVDVTVPVPANAAPGTYSVTLTGVLPDGETRAGTGQFTVSAPPAPAPPAPAVVTTPTVRCLVPRLTGKTIGKTSAVLRSAHCRLGKVRSRNSQTRKGTIIAQSPGPRHVLAAGSKVNVTASLGPKRKRP